MLLVGCLKKSTHDLEGSFFAAKLIGLLKARWLSLSRKQHGQASLTLLLKIVSCEAKDYPKPPVSERSACKIGIDHQGDP